MSPELLALVHRLEDGCGVPHSSERAETYAKAFAKLAAVGFERLVDHVLSEAYAAKQPPRKRPVVPSVPELWQIYRELRSRPGPSKVLESAGAHGDPDRLEYFANRLLWSHIAARGGLGADELQACTKAKRDLVEEFAGYIREGDELATWAEFVRSFTIVIRGQSRLEHETAEAWNRLRQLPDMQVPLPRSMVPERIPQQTEFA